MRCRSHGPAWESQDNDCHGVLGIAGAPGDECSASRFHSVQEQPVRWSRNLVEREHVGGVDADHAEGAGETNRDAVADTKVQCSTLSRCVTLALILRLIAVPDLWPDESVDPFAPFVAGATEARPEVPVVNEARPAVLEQAPAPTTAASSTVPSLVCGLIPHSTSAAWQ